MQHVAAGKKLIETFSKSHSSVASAPKKRCGDHLSETFVRHRALVVPAFRLPGHDRERHPSHCAKKLAEIVVCLTLRRLRLAVKINLGVSVVSNQTDKRVWRGESCKQK
jgi:hypothetical protein